MQVQPVLEEKSLEETATEIADRLDSNGGQMLFVRLDVNIGLNCTRTRCIRNTIFEALFRRFGFINFNLVEKWRHWLNESSMLIVCSLNTSFDFRKFCFVEKTLVVLINKRQFPYPYKHLFVAYELLADAAKAGYGYNSESIENINSDVVRRIGVNYERPWYYSRFNSFSDKHLLPVCCRWLNRGTGYFTIRSNERHYYFDDAETFQTKVKSIWSRLRFSGDDELMIQYSRSFGVMPIIMCSADS